MAVREKLRGYLRGKEGNSAVEFIFTTAMLILLFAVLLSAMVYVTQFYSAGYLARRVTRTIEISGEYNEQAIRALTDTLGGTALEELEITVDAPYVSGRKIQLRDEFTVRLTAVHRVSILRMGDTPISLALPIEIELSGRSEVFWK